MRFPHIGRRTTAYLAACVLAGGGLSVAGAAVLFNGSINGTVANAAAAELAFTGQGSTVSTGDGSGVTCAQNLSGSDSFTSGFDGAFTTDTLTVGNALAGSACKFVVEVFSSDPSTVVQDITWANTGGAGVAYTATLAKADCGTALGTDPGSAVAITFTVTAPTTGWTAGASGDITADIQGVPSGQYVSGNCNGA